MKRASNPEKPKEDLKWLTVYTDAGVKDGVGTYGCWIRVYSGRRTLEGVIPHSNVQSNEAEMYAIVTGVREGVMMWRSDYGVEVPRGITIGTDSAHCIRRLCNPRCPDITTKGNPVSLLERELHREFMELIRFGNVQAHYRFKKVRSHRSTSTTQGWLNDWCDKAATRARMRA